MGVRIVKQPVEKKYTAEVFKKTPPASQQGALRHLPVVFGGDCDEEPARHIAVPEL